MEASISLLRLAALVITATVVSGQDQSISGCGPGTVPQYALLVNSDIQGSQHKEILHVTRATCAHFCSIDRDDTGEPYACKAFGYKEEGGLCYLYDDQAYRGSAANVTEAKGTLVYEKICLPNSHACSIIPAFERNPNRILTGFTQVVLDEITSEEACLSACLRSKEDHDFLCMSTMFYSETKECMLNFESKVTPGVSQYFSNETESFSVDYYDNLCGLRKRDAGVPFNACPDRSTPTFFRYTDSEVSQFHAATFTGLSLPECLKRCNEADNFTCSSVDYRNTTDSYCALSFADHRTSPLSNLSEALNQSDSESVHYERACIEGARLACGGDNRVAFDVMFNVRMPTEYVVVEFPGISPEECLSLCLLDPSNRCRSVNYERITSLCQLTNATRSEELLLETSGDPVVSYENLCHPGNVAVASDSIMQLLMNTTHPDWLQSETDVDTQNVTDRPKLNTPAPTLPNMEMQPMCEYSDMRVRLVAEQPFTGFFFAKNKFGTCRADVENRAEMVLALKFPDIQHPESPCGVAAIGPNKYSVIVVVTSNNMDIPGLVTETDRFFNITCDFTSSSSSLITATGHSMAVNSPKNAPGLFPDGMVVIPSPLNIMLSRPNSAETVPGARETRQVRTAQLGEQLNLDFHYYPGFNRTGMGLFVRQCNASRHSGPPPEPAPLILLEDGCPAQAAKGKIVHGPVVEIESGFRLPITAFRFDGSNSVKISCAIDLCEKGCNPLKCPIDGRQVVSFGKRRRRAFPDRNPNIKRKIEPSSVVFTVVDKLTSFALEPPGNTSTAQKQSHFVKEPKRGYLEQLGAKRQVCLKRATFLGAAAFFGVICFAQVVAIAAYVAHQYVRLGGVKKGN